MVPPLEGLQAVRKSHVRVTTLMPVVELRGTSRQEQTMGTQPEPIAPAVVKVMAAMRRAVELQVKADLARRWDGEGMSVGQIAQLLDVSRNTVYRYLGRDRKRGRQND